MHTYCPHCDAYQKIDYIDDEDRLDLGDGIITADEKDDVVGKTQYCTNCNRRFIFASVKESLIKIAACKI